jgi:hypothetical protein
MSVEVDMMDLVLQARQAVTTARCDFDALCVNVNRDSISSKIFSIGPSLEDLSHSLYRLSSSNSAMETESVRDIVISPLSTAKDGQQRDSAFWSVLLDDIATVTQWLRDATLCNTETGSALQLIESQSDAGSIRNMIRGYNKAVLTLIDVHAL